MTKNRFISAVIFSTVALAVLLTACDKKEGKLPEPEPVAKLSCDTITYTKHIKPIIDANCALSGCHAGTTSNPLLTSYDLVKDRADAGRIKSRAIDASPSQMPPSPAAPLTAEQKELINCWLGNGTKQ